MLLLLLPLAVVTAGSIKPDINLAWLSSFSQRCSVMQTKTRGKCLMSNDFWPIFGQIFSGLDREVSKHHKLPTFRRERKGLEKINYIYIAIYGNATSNIRPEQANKANNSIMHAYLMR